MKKYFTFLSLVALVMMTMTSCLHIKVGDKDWSFGNSGHTNNTPTQVHQVGEVTSMQTFDELNVAGPFNVILEQGESNTVRVDGTTEQLEKMTIYVKDGELYIDQRESKWNGDDFKGLRVFVSTPSIKGIGLAGSGSVTAPKTLTTLNNMRLELAGSGDITLSELKCNDLRMEIAGSGNITTGPIQANEVNSEIAGSGDVSVASLTCKKLHNEIAGSGDLTYNNMNVEHVSSDIAGSGDIYLLGNIGSHSEDIAGSGKVHVNEKK